MNRLNYFILAIIFTILASCALTTNKNKILDLYSDHSQSGIKCIPRVITKNSSIDLYFPENHPKKFAIKNPRDVWYYIYPGNKLTHFVSPLEFYSGTKFTIDVNKIIGIKWENGKPKIEPVFNEPGEYLLYLADNIETEPENTLHVETTVFLKE